MLPLLVIGGVIGAVASIAKGGSWLSSQVSDANGSASAGGKGGLSPLTEAQMSSFSATLRHKLPGRVCRPALWPPPRRHPRRA